MKDKAFGIVALIAAGLGLYVFFINGCDSQTQDVSTAINKIIEPFKNEMVTMINEQNEQIEIIDKKQDETILKVNEVILILNKVSKQQDTVIYKLNGLLSGQEKIYQAVTQKKLNIIKE